MRLRPDQLARHLEQTLAPVYLLSGDEPLQLGEAADAVRAAARRKGYTSRELIEPGAQADWRELAAAGASLSLFAERRLIELRLASSKIGRDGSAALCDYLARPPADTLLLITAPKLERAQAKAAWVQAIERDGVLVQVWPIDGARLGPWIERRLRERELIPEPGVVALLAERIEGNLLAAAQEIEKLLLLNGPGPLSPERLLAAVSDSARYDVFALTDAALAGEPARALRILDGLAGEGVAPPVVLWALARELRALGRLADAAARRESPAALYRSLGIWDKRQPLFAGALRRGQAPLWRALLARCAEADATIKGRRRGEPWELLRGIVARLAGVADPTLGADLSVPNRSPR